MYDYSTLLVLLLMIVTGGARSLVAKLVYQNDFKKPLTLTLLYLLGQFICLPLHYLSVVMIRKEKARYAAEEDEEDGRKPRKGVCTEFFSQEGSKIGLTKESANKTKKLNAMPWYLKPLVPGVFNLLNSALRWAALVLVSASILEIIVTSLELVLSVVAARLLRGRHVAARRWIGVGIVSIGLMIVGGADFVSDDADTDTAGLWLGTIFMIGQCVLSVLQDLAEEVFMQESQFPALQLVGMEGGYGLVAGLILYFPLCIYTGWEPLEEVQEGLQNGTVLGLSLGWCLLVTFAGMFNIMATAKRSSMTRNMWKNGRSILVWVVGLAIFYGSDGSFGEEWVMWKSPMALLGFFIIVSGVYYYYTVPKSEGLKASDEDKTKALLADDSGVDFINMNESSPRDKTEVGSIDSSMYASDAGGVYTADVSLSSSIQ